MTSAEDYEGPGYNPCSEGECAHYHCDNQECQRIMPEATESGVCQMCELKWQAGHMLMDSPTAATLMPHALTSNETGNTTPCSPMAEATDLKSVQCSFDSNHGDKTLQQTAEKELIGIAGFFQHMNSYFEGKR